MTLSRQHIILAVVVVLYSFAMLLLWDYVEEDAYIYYIVARNIALGHGYVYNIGSEHIETGSGFIWQMLLAIAYLLPGNLILHSKLLGALFTLLTFWQVRRIEQHANYSNILALIIALTAMPILFWSQSGMETMAYTAMLLFFIRALTDDKLHTWIWFSGFLVFCGRPEGFLYMGLIPIAVLLNRELRTIIVNQLLMLGTLIIAFHLWRWWYFEDIFINPFYAKSARNLAISFGTTINYFQSTGLIWLLPFALVSLFNKQQRNVVIILLATFAFCTFFTLAHPESKPLFRFSVSAIALIACLFAIGCATLAERIPEKYKRLLPLLIAFNLGGWIYSQASMTLSGNDNTRNPLLENAGYFLQGPFIYSRDIAKKAFDPDIEKHCRLTPIARCEQETRWNDVAAVSEWLNRNLPPGAIVAGDQMGEIPWRSEQFLHFDMFGLTERCFGYARFSKRSETSAHLGIYKNLLEQIKVQPVCSREQAVEHFFDTMPDVILFYVIFYGVKKGTLNEMIYNDPRFKQHYEARYIINLKTAVYTKKSLPPMTEPTFIPLFDLSRHKAFGCYNETATRRYLKNLNANIPENKIREFLQACE